MRRGSANVRLGDFPEAVRGSAPTLERVFIAPAGELSASALTIENARRERLSMGKVAGRDVRKSLYYCVQGVKELDVFWGILKFILRIVFAQPRGQAFSI
jgi:hypothetical protein